MILLPIVIKSAFEPPGTIRIFNQSIISQLSQNFPTPDLNLCPNFLVEFQKVVEYAKKLKVEGSCRK